MKLSIIVPVYNERNTVQELLRRVRAVDLGEIAKEIIIVDDGSTDGTGDILRLEEDSSTKVLRREKNRGKGAAVRAALSHATGDYVIIQDADLEYDPEDYRDMLAPVMKRKADVVYGSRFTGGHRDMLYWHWVGNKFLSFMTNVLYNTTLSDMETCYKLFSRESLEGIEIHSDRFEFEPEITAKILKKKVRIYEVPVSYAGREYEEGKKIVWMDGFKALWALLKYRFFD
jgi:glycosyltransferase involved in cell wall biosynthesis